MKTERLPFATETYQTLFEALPRNTEWIDALVTDILDTDMADRWRKAALVCLVNETPVRRWSFQGRPLEKRLLTARWLVQDGGCTVAEVLQSEVSERRPKRKPKGEQR